MAFSTFGPPGPSTAELEEESRIPRSPAFSFVAPSSAAASVGRACSPAFHFGSAASETAPVEDLSASTVSTQGGTFSFVFGSASGGNDACDEGNSTEGASSDRGSSRGQFSFVFGAPSVSAASINATTGDRVSDEDTNGKGTPPFSSSAGTQERFSFVFGSSSQASSSSPAAGGNDARDEESSADVAPSTGGSRGGAFVFGSPSSQSSATKSAGVDGDSSEDTDDNGNKKVAPHASPRSESAGTHGRFSFVFGLPSQAAPSSPVAAVTSAEQVHAHGAAGILGDEFVTVSCDKCGTTVQKDKAKQCQGCHSFYYCGLTCQFSHYFSHKVECDVIQKTITLDGPDEKHAASSNDEGTGSREKSCSICFDDMDDALSIRIPSCKHRFCYECIRVYQLRTDPSIACCPICRGYLPFDVSQIFYDRIVGLARRGKNRPDPSPERQSDLKAARDMIELVLDLEPTHERSRCWRNLRADLLYHSGEYQESLSIVEKHHNERWTPKGTLLPKHVLFHEAVLMARCKMKRKSFKAAAAMLQRCVTENRILIVLPPKSKECRELQGDLAHCLFESAMLYYRRKGNLKRASAEFKECLKKCVGACEIVLQEDRHCNNGVYGCLSMAHEQLGEWDDAVRVMKRAVVYEEPWNGTTVARNQRNLKELVARVRAKKEAEEKERIAREVARRKMQEWQRDEARRRREDAARKKAELEVLRKAWRPEKEKAVAKAEEEDRQAGRVRLADLKEGDCFYTSGKKGEKKGNRQRGHSSNPVTEQEMGDLEEHFRRLMLSETAHYGHMGMSFNEGWPHIEETQTPPSHGRSSSSDGEQTDSSEEEVEVLVYTCECCRKEFKSVNQLENHIRSKKHRKAEKVLMRKYRKEQRQAADIDEES